VFLSVLVCAVSKHFAMLGKAMRFATVWILAFAICGKANRFEDAAVSKGTTEDLEHRSRQETNFEAHVSTTSSCSKGGRLAVIALAVTSANAFAPGKVRPFQKDSNHALNQNLATPQVFWHDMTLYAHRDVEAFLHVYDNANSAELDGADLMDPTPAVLEAFRSLNKRKDCKILESKDSAAPLLHQGEFKTQFNVFREYTGRMKKVAAEFDLSPEEAAAQFGFKNGDHDIINTIARGASAVGFIDCDADQGITGDMQCLLTDEDMFPYLEVLQASLKKMPEANGRLYRGVGFDVDDEGFRSMLYRYRSDKGDRAPISGFSSFHHDFRVAEYYAKARKKDGIQPTIFVMDEHSSGRILYPGDMSSPDQEAVVFGVGTNFVIQENEQVRREVEALWRETFKKEAVPDAVPDFKVLVVKEVPADDDDEEDLPSW